jgi:enoyl-CoA hydratase/carnithine racemase
MLLTGEPVTAREADAMGLVTASPDADVVARASRWPGPSPPCRPSPPERSRR